MTLLTFMQNAAQFVTGQFGIELMIVAIAATAIAGLSGHGFRYLTNTLGCGAVLFSAAWIVNTFFAG